MRILQSAPATCLSLFTVILLFCMCWQDSEAGVISLLGKLAKKADVDTPAINKLDIDLPLDKDIQIARTHMDQNGDWRIQTPDLKSVTISRHGEFADNKIALVVDSHQLPPSLDDLARIPDGYTLYIKQNQKAFLLKRAPDWEISHNDIAIKVNSIDDIKRVVWHMQRPWANKTIFVSGLPHRLNAGVAAKIQGVNINDFLNNPRKFRQQTLVLPGIWEGNTFHIAGSKTQAVDIKRMKSLAREHDTSLVFLHADSDKTVRKLGQNLETAFSTNTLYDDTAAFIDRLNPDAGAMTLEIYPSGQSQVAISARVKTAEIKEPASPAQQTIRPSTTGLEITAHAALKLAQFYRPDKTRSEELDRRIIPWLPAWLQYYMIISILLGVIVWSFSRSIWARLWKPKTRDQFNHSAFYILYRLAHETVFLLVFLPFFGAICFVMNVLLIIYRILRGIALLIWSVFNFVFVKPVRFLLGLKNLKQVKQHER